MSRRSAIARALRPIAAGIAAAAGLAALLWWTVAHRDAVSVTALGRTVEFLEPRWLLLIALCPYFFVVRAWALTDVSTAQQLLTAAWRSLVVAVLALALARPVHTAFDDRVATVVLVDVSDSISDAQLERARQWVADVDRAQGERDQLYVVTFAERPRRVPRGPDGTFAIARHDGAGAGTNLQAALQLAYGLFPPGYLPRVVFVSDGNETAGDVLAEAYRAAELGVRVSFHTVEQGRVDEIRIAAVRIPDEIKVGAPFEVTVDIWSSHPETVTVALEQDDFPNPLEPRKTVSLVEGANRVKFKAQAKRAGFTTFRASLVSPQRDTEPKNNAMTMTAPVRGRPRVLYVEGGVQRDRSQASYLARALDQEHIDVEVRGPRGIPSRAKDLERFDLVIISDVPAHFMGLAQMQAIESYVRDLGGGLIMAGGEDSFGSGGYQGTRIEKIMPVRFDSERIREQPNVAIALVIDRSGSMSGAKIEAAKESARATAEVLSPRDLIAVVAFDNQPTTIVRLQRASNRMRISTDIARLQAGGGTNIYPALQEAFRILQSARAKVKHVILLSDGQAPYDGIADLCQEMRANRITVSAVGIGDADRNLLQIIADNGEGNLYMTDDLANLPRIFMKETTEAQKSALVEDLVKAIVVKNVEMIEGTGVANAPFLRGYVSTKPKPTAEVILVSELGEPLLARWRVGLGTSVAWTSDVKNRWSTDWIRWKGYPKFWAQVVRTAMRRKVYDSYDLFAEVADGRARVMVDAIDNDDAFVNGLDTTLEIVDPATSKTVRTVPMEQTAAGRYTAEFAFDRYGSFLLKAVHRRDGRVVAESLGSVALPYPAEYTRSTPNTAALRQVAVVTGGTASPAPAALFDPRGESIPYTRDLWPWFLLAAAGLALVDLYLKRVRLFGYRPVAF
ncbi:MAG: VWA domain-containing protein [Deltaproteobacteria bacterium]|nr:MAG: VWA domain-containing protein [Deltaproteobacteria bacterium]